MADLRKRRKRRRLVYREHAHATVALAVRGAIGEASVFMDWLELVCLDEVSGANEYERGVAEGKRRLASEIMAMVLVDDEPDVETNSRKEA